VTPTDDVLAAPGGLDAALEGLERDGRALLDRSGHGLTGEIAFELDMRYRGQAYNLTVGLAARPVTAATVAAAEAAFVEAHRRAYDYTPSLEETEIVTIRARATAPGARFEWGAEGGSGAAGRSRSVWFAGERRDCAVVDRSGLRLGDTVDGPAILEEEDSTVLVSPGWVARTAADEVLVIERSEG
jgi:N-methylhydantoinase A